MKQKKGGQQNLDGIVQRVSQSAEFSWEGILKAVAEFIVCDNQVSDVNCMCVDGASMSCRA